MSKTFAAMAKRLQASRLPCRTNPEAFRRCRTKGLFVWFRFGRDVMESIGTWWMWAGFAAVAINDIFGSLASAASARILTGLLTVCRKQIQCNRKNVAVIRKINVDA